MEEYDDICFEKHYDINTILPETVIKIADAYFNYIAELIYHPAFKDCINLINYNALEIHYRKKLEQLDQLGKEEYNTLIRVFQSEIRLTVESSYDIREDKNNIGLLFDKIDFITAAYSID